MRRGPGARKGLGQATRVCPTEGSRTEARQDQGQHQTRYQGKQQELAKIKPKAPRQVLGTKGLRLRASVPRRGCPR